MRKALQKHKYIYVYLFVNIKNSFSLLVKFVDMLTDPERREKQSSWPTHFGLTKLHFFLFSSVHLTNILNWDEKP